MKNNKLFVAAMLFAASASAQVQMTKTSTTSILELTGTPSSDAGGLVPLRLYPTAYANLPTTPPNGAVEFDGDSYWGTIGGVRNKFAFASGTTSFTTGSIPFAGTDGFLTQDNTNFFWDNTNKRMGIGYNTPAAEIDIRKTSVAPTARLFGASTASGYYGKIQLGSARGSIGSESAIQSNDVLGSYDFWGYNGSSYVLGAFIRSQAYTDWTTSSHYSNVAVYATASGATTPVQLVRFAPSGVTDGANMIIGGESKHNSIGTDGGSMYYRASASDGYHLWINNALGTDEFKMNLNDYGLSINNGSTGCVSGVALDVNGNASFNGHLLPRVNGTYDIGNSTYRWREVFATNGMINTSDVNKKERIEDIKYGLTDLMRLRPVSYHWKENDNGLRLGFIAQETQKVINEVVVHDEAANVWGMRYTELIPVIVKSIQEQQEIITALQNTGHTATTGNSNDYAELKQQLAAKDAQIATMQDRLTNLEQRLNTCCQNTNVNPTSVDPLSVLEQNVPNPFNGETTIGFKIAGTNHTAFIGIYDMNGREIKKISITGDMSSVTVPKGMLLAGMYTYSLIVDAKLIDTKRMVVID